LRLRFDARELTLLKGAEQLRGVALAHTPRPEQLRTALNLAKAGHKLGRGHAAASVSLDEGEVRLLVDAVRYATDEVHWLTRASDENDDRRRDAILQAFPELTERGVWRSFGLARELETLAARLHSALIGKS
jgi:hypothetical protein